VDGTYALKPWLSLGVRFRYGLTIPTLCPSSADCTASLGHDVGLAVFERWTFGAWGRFEPALDVELGHDWLSTQVSDHSVTATRSYRGWSAGIEAEGMFALSKAISIGPLAGLSGGVFQRSALSAPGVEASASTDGKALHLWPTIAFRAAFRF
jgi:hypothetical protein